MRRPAAASLPARGRPPLVAVAGEGDETFVRALHAEGASLVACDADGRTAFLAACSGKPNVVSLLRSMGADVGARDGHGMNGMHVALKASRTMADALPVLEDLNGVIDTTQEDDLGRTPLDMLGDMEVGEDHGYDDIELRVREIL
jgi:ankyrin repeat protein